MILILILGICLSTQPSYAKVSYGGGFDNLNVAPVFLISNHDIFNSFQNKANPLKITKQAEFADIIHKVIVKSNIIIIFSEHRLCVEDISSKDDYGTPFSNLRKVFLEQNSRYFPSVQNPHSILEQMLVPLQTNILYTKGVDAQLRLPKDLNKHLYVFFEDGANETRASELRRHDAILSNVWKIATTTGPSQKVVCAIYTGKVSPIPKKKYRLRVMPRTDTTEKSILVVSEKARFLFRSVKLASLVRTRFMEGSPEVAEETWNHHKLSTRMAYSDFELEFNFLFRNVNWELDHVRLLEDGEEVGRAILRISAPLRMSYVCGEPIVIVNTRDGSTITISDYQIQPYRTKEKHLRQGDGEDGAGEGGEGRGTGERSEPPKGEEEDHPIAIMTEILTKRSATPGDGESPSSFGDSVHCGPYFTVAILTGLFIVGLMLGIVLVGITMLMNCPTNDRYDDTNAKPFVVKTF